jgi:hypothetical protein
MACAHYVAEIFIKNRLDALLKPIVGINHGRNAPLIKANDKNDGIPQTMLLGSFYTWVFHLGKDAFKGSQVSFFHSIISCYLTLFSHLLKN